MIDTSPDLRQQALRENIAHVDAVAFTHGHSDHILGLDDLRVFNFFSRKVIPCYSDQATIDGLIHTFNYIFNPDPNYQGGLLAKLSPHVIEAAVPFSAAGLRFQPFRLMHGRAGVLGFRCGDFAYATDCNQVPDAARQILQGVRYLILDGLRYEPHATHFTIPKAVEVAKEIGAEQTYLTHMTHNVDYDEVSAKLPAGVALAYDGLRLICQGETC